MSAGEVCLNRGILKNLSHRGIMAYLAVTLAGPVEASTAVLAGLVGVQTSVMLEGLKELAAGHPELAVKGKTKWRCGGKPTDGLVQNLDSDRFRELVDDLKTYWDHLNPGLPFAMGGADGAAIRGFLADHREWNQEHWREALNNRAKSPVSKSAPMFTWVKKLGEYAAGPLNEFNKPNGSANGFASKTRHNIDQAKQAVLEIELEGPRDRLHAHSFRHPKAVEAG